MEPSQDLGCPHVIIWLATFPFHFILNLAIILFIIFAFTTTLASSSATNILAIVVLIVFYVANAIIFALFCWSSGIWNWVSKLVMGLFTMICAIVGFPLFYLFSLPYAWFFFVRWIGWPTKCWHFIFGDGCCSLESFGDIKQNAGFSVLKGIYIGIPFLLFCVLWLVFVIICFPLIYALFAPYGFGIFGCSLHYWCLLKCESCETLYQIMNSSFYYSILGSVYALSLPMIVLSIIHIITAGVTWYGIFLLVASMIYFLAFIYFTIAPLFSRSARQIV